ncbi:BTAD domain-containing putative transcriptional regulator [Undibacterium sp. Ji49W]|uniref:BTAD domain-containing putative transcriptional regulator n=1 Tax=Undibacterium sp. Ji49W TaxID=3413040 RepID=UPI003BF45D3F
MQRPRLFSLLDRLFQQHAIVWVVSPPGAGKTTLAASYLAQSRRTPIWYQIDELDGDSGTLFFFLSEASNYLAKPVSITHEDKLRDAKKLDRLYFRDFYANLPPDTIIVFDNIQDFDWQNGIHLIESALSEIPAGISILVLSREAPPARFSRMQLDHKLSVVNWNEISLTQEEALNLARLHTRHSEIDTQWLSLVDGWAAGIVMLRDLARQADDSPLQRFNGRDELFKYFAGEIFERMPAQHQLILLKLSVMTGMTENDAITLSGDQNAPALFKSLYYKSLFLERRGTEPYSYHFHALFREFLRHEFNSRIDEHDQISLRHIAARLHEEKGQIEDAVILHQRNANFQQLIQLLISSAEGMLKNGRGQVWRDWISAIPPAVMNDVPELWYWQGMFLNDVAPRQARTSLIRAANTFHGPAQLHLKLLAIAAIIEGYDTEAKNYDELGPWIKEMLSGLEVLDVSTTGVGSEIELRLYSRLLLALLLFSPESADPPHLIKQVIGTLRLATEPVEKLSAGSILLRVIERGFEVTAGQINWLLATMQDCLSAFAAQPLNQLKWLRQIIRWHQNEGNLHESSRFLDEIKNIVNSSNLDPILAQLIEIEYLIATGDVKNSRHLLDQIQTALPSSPDKEHIEFQILEAKWHALNNNVSQTIRCLHHAFELSDKLRVKNIGQSHLEMFLAACHAQQDEFILAMDWCTKALAHANGYELFIAQECQIFIRACAQISTANNKLAIQLLNDALTRHQQRKAITLFPLNPMLAARLIDFALKKNIQPEHARNIIVRQNLNPPDKFTPHWPWPVSVRIFGQFELLISGESVAHAGGGQQKPLLLLKILICAGNKGLGLKSVASQLWPDSETARTTLNVTVHRLRKILGGDDRILIANGNIFISESRTWSDLAAITNSCQVISTLDSATSTASIVQLGNELLGLYRGPLCAEESDSWLVAHRERWNNHFREAVTQLGRHLENAEEWGLAATLYRKVLEVDALAESSYRGLMRCAHAKNDIVTAVAAFRRCRETLSILVGLPPSAETVSLAIELGLIIAPQSD